MFILSFLESSGVCDDSIGGWFEVESLGVCGFDSVMGEEMGHLGSGVVPSLDSESTKRKLLLDSVGSLVIESSCHF